MAFYKEDGIIDGVILQQITFRDLPFHCQYVNTSKKCWMLMTEHLVGVITETSLGTPRHHGYGKTLILSSAL